MAHMRRLLAISFGLSLMSSSLAPIALPVQAQTPHRSIERLLEQADQAEAAQDYRAALELYQQAFDQLPAAELSEQKRRILFRIAGIYRDRREYDKAIPYLQKILPITRKFQDHLRHGIALRAIGISQRNLQQYDEALQSLQDAKTTFFKQPDRYWQMIAWYDLGNLYSHREEYQLALTALQQALPIAAELGRDQSVGEITYKIGLALHDLKRYPEAIATYEKSIPMLRAAKYTYSETNAYLQRGRAYNAINQSAAAIANLKTALQLAQRYNQERLEYFALQNLGLVYNGLSQPNQAAPYLKQAAILAEKSDSPHHRLITLEELALLALNQGQYAQAINRYNDALQLAQELGDRKAQKRIIANLGIAQYSVGDYKQAYKTYQRAYQLATQIGDRSGQGKVLGSLGILFRVSGQYKQALQYSQASLAIARELNDRDEETITLLDIGLVQMSLTNYPAAIAAFEASLKLSQQMQDEVGIGKIYGNLGVLYERQGNYAKAEEYMRKSVALAEDKGDLRERGVGLSNLGTIQIGLKQYTQAEANLRASIAIWDQQRRELDRTEQYNTVDRQKIGIFERQRLSYQHLQRALVAQGKAEAALEVAEQARTRALIELMARKRSGTVQLQETENINITQLKRIAQAQKATLVEYSIIRDWIDVDLDGQSGSKREIRDSELLIWVIQPDGQVHLRQVDLTPQSRQNAATIASTIANTRRNLGVRSRGKQRVQINTVEGRAQLPLEGSISNSTNLHQLLIKPIADLLPQDPQQHVIFIPHKFLFNVPFAAIQDEQGRYLIEQHTIRTAPSIQVLGLTQNHPNSITTSNQALFSNALIVGNPQMPTITDRSGKFTETLSSLPNAETEAKAVAALTNTQALIGKAATKHQVLEKMRRAKLIHLATHGLLDDFKDLGIPGAIALAPDGTGEPNDGILTTDELTDTQFKLQADLVVLSACDTGAGKITGDGVIGLSRAFLGAGVPSVVVSLWAVNDESTAFLMTEFYRNLKTTDDRAAALRQAMLTTRKQYPDPYDWAAFTLVGQQ